MINASNVDFQTSAIQTDTAKTSVSSAQIAFAAAVLRGQAERNAEEEGQPSVQPASEVANAQAAVACQVTARALPRRRASQSDPRGPYKPRTKRIGEKSRANYREAAAWRLARKRKEEDERQIIIAKHHESWARRAQQAPAHSPSSVQVKRAPANTTMFILVPVPWHRALRKWIQRVTSKLCGLPQSPHESPPSSH